MSCVCSIFEPGDLHVLSASLLWSEGSNVQPRGTLYRWFLINSLFSFQDFTWLQCSFV
jgi:hypothetical protein